MANEIRGEIEAEIDGQTRILCLTLGALAELETSLGATDLMELTERFSKGQVSVSHLINLIGAGLRGAGNDITDRQLSDMHFPNGVRGAAEIAARLLEVTFGQANDDPGQ